MGYNAITGEVYVPDEKNNLLDVLAPRKFQDLLKIEKMR
jgi:hypothetical protein